MNGMFQNGVFDLISQSGPIAKLILLVLLSASVFSWALIFSKLRVLKKASWENTEFLNLFWNSRSMDEVLAKSERFERSPVARIFKNGARELKKVHETPVADPSLGVENVGRALSRSANSEVADLERNVSWLATTASATPFIGLFGTVWGIMNSFQSIGASGAANLAVVAPGISEALITTAMGIAAAVPAVIAYNHIVVKIRRISIDMDCFSQDFLNIIQRRLPNQAGKAGN
jgi:biopolymer transport protein TolQ